VTQPPDAPQTGSTPAAPITDESFVRIFARMTGAFCTALAIVGVLGVTVILEQPTVRTTGLAVGVVLGLVSWFGARLIIRTILARATARGVAPAGATAAASTAIFAGIAVAEAPALFGLVYPFIVEVDDVGALVIAVPVAIVSLIVNVSGPSAVRGHLARLRSPIAF
jgi:hypothetical protein